MLYRAGANYGICEGCSCSVHEIRTCGILQMFGTSARERFKVFILLRRNTMCRKLSFLVAVVLVLALGGTANAIAPTTDLDVNNYSFELDNDGNQVCGHTGNTLGIGWTLGTANWVGQDVNCAYPGFCGGCDPEEPESEGGNCNCKVWDASDGVIMCYMQTNNCWFSQYLTDTIQARTQYTLKMDAMTWNAAVRFRPTIIYDSGGPQPTEVSGKDITLEQTTDANTYEWKEYKVVLVVPDGHPAIGEPIGIRWWCYKDGVTGRWPFLDNIRVTSQPATDAWGPNPDDEEINVVLDLAKLTWGAGLWAKKHNVYFGTSWADVNNRDAGTLIGTQQDANDVNVPISLVIGGEYFWAVDEYNDTYVQGPCDPPTPPWTGEVWSFKTNDGKAYDFSPQNEAEGMPIDVNLAWTPGVAVDVHNVYFSTSFDDVNSRAVDANQGHQGPNTFDPTPTGVLALAQTYYWAVDEVNAGTVGSPWQSDVLEFTTIDHVVVEDFNSYANPTELLTVWNDYWTNGTQVTINPEKDANFTEDGNALKYFYENNLSPYYAEAYADIADLAIDPNWTTNGVEALRLAFMGEADNAIEPMYVALTDGSNRTGKVLYHDANELNKEWKGFQEWNIDLQEFVDDNSVDLTDISRLTIGLGDKTAGGSGYVYFDNIRLHPPRCVLMTAFAGGNIDFDEDCLVDNADLDVFTQRDWLISATGNITATPPDANFLTGWWKLDDNVKSGQTARDVVDSSAYGYDGLLYDSDKAPGENTYSHQDPCYVEGTGALTFDGYDDFVNLPAFDLNSNTVTISAWIKRDGDLPMYAGILNVSYADPCDANLSTLAGLNFGSGGSLGFAEWAPWEINHELAYFWYMDANDTPLADNYGWDWHSGMVVPDQQWVLAALVVEPTQGTIYMYDGTLYASRNPLKHYPELWHGPARLGDQVQNPDRLFKGTMDDVRVYDYSLTPEEVLYMALQGAGSQYIKLPWWRADLDDDNTINFDDYGLMADNWLKELFFP